ncbi:MAG: hypothetical protein UU82_C0025G0003 [Candidatus Nomurabacteria bacterium GW2011_GWC2_41_8]|uniref:Uncharacterized protein n=3 Tax=Candidatus Nomuraibacteriota TaxID=1752729 RepID=A0A1F6YCN4_9BACT|nr:MAG: hypothetical protein US18_C0042G0007 [Parcubacteria group bacterium GW2011_GWB1_36_5]KKS04582.1 MAG: hypothetical protein UU58_C0005G0031 [Candidatus Nomurabacteria bacterium GW2011_GWA2_41_25]KKS23605.1 MAG: hypothetical protein UU82_C0025G0003 [Candidatus Nomurabacteria bacterium GW2011_GWC2_41_8]OGI67352.1 MAG: hypothetical protein A2823_00085 [Candidatus Nomurabacteria bacterium RIFCSPHIGHO2_01_FULL_41_91]OGI80637.1 MAG: hypothetical protein A3D43_00700 [Candidatus Nomurabacteria ba
MIVIKDLLGKFNNILLSEEGRKESIRSIISEIIKVEISSREIEIKNNTVYLNIKPIYKNEILLKREQIFLKLKKSLNKGVPQDMR